MMGRAELQEPARPVEADRPEAPRADAQGLQRREDVGAVGGPEQPAEGDWLRQGTEAYRRVVHEIAALGEFAGVTLLPNSYPPDAGVCVECMTEQSVVWAQCVHGSTRKSNSGHLCSLECLRVWAIKQRLMRDEIK